MRKNLAILLMVPVLLTGCKTNETTTEPNQEPKSPYGQTDKTYYYYSMVHTQYSYYTVDFSEDFRTIKTQNVDNEERSVIYLTEDYQLKEVRSYLDATEESIDSKYIYLYDERGLLKQETCFVYDSEVGNGYIFRKTNYKYDDSGRVIEEAGFESLRPGLLTEDYLYEYRYEDNVFYEIHYDFDNFKKEFDIGWKTITSINELENRKTETYYKIDKNLQETQLDYISLYELDTGNELKTDFYEDDGVTISSSFEYTYNDFGDQTSYKDTTSHITSTSEVEYDSKGYIVKETHQTKINDTGEIANKYELTYETDDNGVVTRVHYEYYSDGVLNYEYDMSFEVISANYFLPFLYEVFAMQQGHYN